MALVAQPEVERGCAADPVRGPNYQPIKKEIHQL